MNTTLALHSHVLVNDMPESAPNSKTINLSRKSSSDLKDLLKSVNISSIPVNFDDGIQYVPLISIDDLPFLSTVSSTQLKPEYKNLLLAQTEAGLTFMSELTKHELYPIKPDYELYLINTTDDNYYVVYGLLKEDVLSYF
jgi:hypothetical protein